MIFINVQFHVKPEYADNFLEEIDWYTQACRAEDGCLDFKWFWDPDDKQKFLLLETYKDGEDVTHVESEHFKRGCDEFPKYLVETPDIINFHIDGKTSWDKMSEYQV